MLSGWSLVRRGLTSYEKGRSTGFEPATFGTTIQRSSQLSYDRHREETDKMLGKRGCFRQSKDRFGALFLHPQFRHGSHHEFVKQRNSERYVSVRRTVDHSLFDQAGSHRAKARRLDF